MLKIFNKKHSSYKIPTLLFSPAAASFDAYRDFEVLAEHPRIDKNKVSITGWSLGGGVTLFSAWLPLKEAINKELSFASHLAFYPPCFINPDNTDFSKSPIHILIGEIDNCYCRNY